MAVWPRSGLRAQTLLTGPVSVAVCWVIRGPRAGPDRPALDGRGRGVLLHADRAAAGGAQAPRRALPTPDLAVPLRRVLPAVSSCVDCLAWGVSGASRCSSCSAWRHDHPGEAACAGCGRVLAAKHGYCRLCWQQARREARASGGVLPRGLPRGAVSVFEAGGWGRLTDGHQLFFDRMKLRRPEGPTHPHGRRRGAPPKPPPAPAARPAPGPVQLRLLDPPRDYRRVDPDAPADPDNRWLAWALYLAHRLGEARGWKKSLRVAVARGL